MSFNTSTTTSSLVSLDLNYLRTSTTSLLQANPGLVLALFLTGYFSILQYVQSKKRDVHVPAIGPAGRLTSYLGAVRMLTGAREMLEEGYAKYTTFKLPHLDRWQVVVNTPELIDEIRRAPEDKMSFIEATEDTLAVKYTMGPYVHGNHYHAAIVRAQLTRNLGELFDDMRDEIERAFEDNIPKSDDWVTLKVVETVIQVVIRTSNRLFIGLPLCRDKDWIDLNVRHTLDVVKGAAIISRFPNLMKGLVGEVLTSVPQSTRSGMKHLRPIIEYRFAQLEKYGKEYPGKPNDMLSWLIDEAPENERRNVKALTQRILTLNFAAIHTSNIVFSQSLLHLASRPEDIIPLREEVERVVREEGWSKDSVAKMRRVDSYIREALRVDGIGLLSMTRKVLVDNYTLSDGTSLPLGTHVTVNLVSTHNDEKYYKNARAFDGFRYVRDSAGNLQSLDYLLGEEEGEEEEEREREKETKKEETKNAMVATSNEYLTFGHGKHACPGRFFAAAELKTMLAHLVLNYDIQLAPEHARDGKPKTIHVMTACIPDPKARVSFRRRK